MRFVINNVTITCKSINELEGAVKARLAEVGKECAETEKKLQDLRRIERGLKQTIQGAPAKEKRPTETRGNAPTHV